MCMQHLTAVDLHAGAEHLTYTIDGWSDAQMRSIYAHMIITADRAAYVLKYEDLSSEKHTKEYIAGMPPLKSHLYELLDEHLDCFGALQRHLHTYMRADLNDVRAECMITAIKALGPEKVATILSDNAANMRAARDLAIKDPELRHIIPLRCFMHGFSLCIGSILGHPDAVKIVSQAQRIVTYFNASHIPHSQLKATAKAQGINTGLKTSNSTRFTSVINCCESVAANKDPLRTLVRDDIRKSRTEQIIACKRPRQPCMCT